MGLSGFSLSISTVTGTACLTPQRPNGLPRIRASRGWETPSASLPNPEVLYQLIEEFSGNVEVQLEIRDAR